MNPMGPMDNLVCTACGTTYYSAAAQSMIDRGERCDCGALLRANVDEAEVPVGAPEPGPAQAKGQMGLRPRRRFARG
jgi:hypothetical protein